MKYRVVEGVKYRVVEGVLFPPLTPEQVQAAKERAALKRRARRLEQLVTGWLEFRGLRQLADRDAVLALLSERDRAAVLEFEREIGWGVDQ